MPCAGEAPAPGVGPGERSGRYTSCVILSEPGRLLFVHVHRTGGTSVANLLLERVPGAAPFLGQHDPAARAREALGSRFESLFRFAFVRNPWDRAVSWYALLEQATDTGEAAAPGFAELVRRRPDALPPAQIELLSDAAGMLLVDEVGRYEHFERDLRRILARAGVAAGEVPRANAARHAPYSHYYDAETRELVGRRYARDVERFGYAFGE